MINKHYKQVKKVLKKGKIVDSYFVSKFSFSPYMACEHSCKYCDGRAEKYYVEGDFEKDIIVRENVVEQLDQDLGKLRDWGVVSIGSGISDSYQPCEREEEKMRECLKVLIKHRFPCLIITKSSNIMRDFDLLKELNELAGVTIASSLTFPDDEHRKIIEPGASPIEERVESLKQLKAAGIGVGAMAMPILPLLVDNDKDLVRLFDLYAGIGLDFIMPGSLTLRPGENKKVFFEILKRYYPQHLRAYEKLYEGNYISGSPSWTYTKPFYKKVEMLMKERSLSPVIPYQLYNRRFPNYDVVFIYLKHLKVLYKDYKNDIDRLIASYDRYKEWYFEFTYRMKLKRSLNYHDLETEFNMLVETGFIQDLIGNDKLYNQIMTKVIDV